MGVHEPENRRAGTNEIVAYGDGELVAMVIITIITCMDEHIILPYKDVNLMRV